MHASWNVRLHYAADGGADAGPDGVSGGAAIPLTCDPAGLSAAQKAAFPHLAGYAAFHAARRSAGRGAARR